MTAKECLNKADFEVEHAIGLAIDWRANVLNFTEAMDDGEAAGTGAARSNFEVAFAAFAPALAGNRRSDR